jgi:hypothetical protein
MRPVSFQLSLALSVLVAAGSVADEASRDIPPPLTLHSDAGSHSLEYDGTLLHTTGNLIRDPQLIPLPGSNGVSVLWDEERPGGSAMRFYAISLDGRIFSRVRQASHAIRLRHAEFDPLVAAPQVEPRLRASPGAELQIVQFVTRPIEEYRAAIRGLGAEIYTFLADQARIVRMSAEVQESVRALPFVRWVGPVHAAFKIEEEILDQLLTRAAIAPRRYSIMLYERGAVAQERVASEIRAAGGEGRSRWTWISPVRSAVATLSTIRSACWERGCAGRSSTPSSTWSIPNGPIRRSFTWREAVARMEPVSMGSSSRRG